jgi:starch phosphorylase
MFGDGHIYEALLKTVYEHDHYLVSTPLLREALVPNIQVSNDFGSYIEAQGLVDELWGGDHNEWDKRSVRTAFAMGEFSSDRSVQDYADGIWSGKSCS